MRKLVFDFIERLLRQEKIEKTVGGLGRLLLVVGSFALAQIRNGAQTEAIDAVALALNEEPKRAEPSKIHVERTT
jgi:hypothetical protein